MLVVMAFTGSPPASDGLRVGLLFNTEASSDMFFRSLSLLSPEYTNWIQKELLRYIYIYMLPIMPMLETKTDMYEYIKSTVLQRELTQPAL
jgi:hypothetical protein